MVESSSLYRLYRMQQLLADTHKLQPEDAARILRDQNGLNNRSIGLTNEKGINQLIAHHSVIFQPAQKRMWVSASPYQLGKYVCYNLDSVFSKAENYKTEHNLNEESKTIAADSFLYSSGYKRFLLFKQLKNYIQYCTKSPFPLKVEERFLNAFIASNPESYFTHWICGDYYLKMGDTLSARSTYNLALTKEVATQKEAETIKEKVKNLQQPAAVYEH
jgi:hypothetical protein